MHCVNAEHLCSSDNTCVYVDSQNCSALFSVKIEQMCKSYYCMTLVYLARVEVQGKVWLGISCFLAFMGCW